MFRAEPGQGRRAGRSSRLDESPTTGRFRRSAHAGSKLRAAARPTSIFREAGRMRLLIAMLSRFRLLPFRTGHFSPVPVLKQTQPEPLFFTIPGYDAGREKFTRVHESSQNFTEVHIPLTLTGEKTHAQAFRRNDHDLRQTRGNHARRRRNGPDRVRSRARLLPWRPLRLLVI